MRPYSVVVASPFLERQTRLHQRREQGLVQELVAQATVEALDEGVLHRFPGIDVVPLDARFGSLAPVALLVSSGPLSLTIDPGLPRAAMRRLSSREVLRPDI